MKSDRPSLFRVLAFDYFAFLSLLAIVFGWTIFFASRPSPDLKPLFFAIGITGAAVVVFLWRLYYFIRMFDNGVETPAIIKRFLYARIHGKIEYTYTYQGTEYSVYDNVFKATAMQEIVIGLQVTALVNPNNPTQAIIKDLYVKS